ncbi:MAG: LegC family aminotransferase [Magnetospirillum sp. WYHS-4]
MTRIPLCVPHLAGNEAAYLKECVDTNWVSSAGPFVDRFERDMAARLGLSHAVATVNGTAALHLALLVAGVRPGDIVPMSNLTFIAPANAVRYLGASPLFVDADPATWQMDAGLLVRYLEDDCEPCSHGLRERATGQRIGALLPVHILGHPVDMDPILDVARRFAIPVIEDATESLGAAYKKRPVGTLADAACLSFNGNKLMTSGGGGMVVTGRADWAERIRHLATQAKSDALEFVHDEIGYNYRLTNLQAALGVAQLERLDDLIATKRRIALRYRQAFADLPGLHFMPQASWAESVFWLSTVRIDAKAFGMDRKAVGVALAARGIETRPLWQPMHRSPAHAGARTLGGAVAERLQGESLSLPSSCGMTEEHQERVVKALVGLSPFHVRENG